MSNNPAVKNNTAKHAWDKKAYDIMRFRVSKSSRDLIVSAAASSGETVNAFISNAVMSRLGLTEWPNSHPSVHRSDPTPASACVVCGNPLPEGKARYCSEACKKKARAAQAREARRKRLSQSQPPED